MCTRKSIHTRLCTYFRMHMEQKNFKHRCFCVNMFVYIHVKIGLYMIGIWIVKPLTIFPLVMLACRKLVFYYDHHDPEPHDRIGTDTI